ncbi:flagellar export chaperone FliS [Alkalihalophilus pseudofirmus]|uniref:flagellar export chaperone FliS n=1 Tax=Alkalihalobacterium alkalinitrilicum TaxID=427920 RepID=UPI00094CBDD2|nr:flagellar export chaperone FliS [Alkalihalobacterium alkalinitrilicum]OLO38104.1 flagellar export chaperone FliS [Alkalihalophilus pseudofirmus]
MAINYQNAYKQNTTNTASPGELTLMLYNGCLKFINRAKKAMEENNIEQRNENIARAEAIIRELMVTLKTEHETGKNMLRMYDFILSRLIDANIKNDVDALKQAEDFVTQFRDTWKQVLQLDRQQRHGATVGGKA